MVVLWHTRDLSRDFYQGLVHQSNILMLSLNLTKLFVDYLIIRSKSLILVKINKHRLIKQFLTLKDMLHNQIGDFLQN